jgi:hypothetical protein
MLQPLFHIEAENIETTDLRLCRLLIVVDADSLSYVLLNIENMQPLCVKYFQFNQIRGRLQEEILREIIFGDEMLSRKVNETLVVYNLAESTLVPEVFFDKRSDKEFINLAYGNLDKGLVVSEKIPWWDIYNVYRLPIEVHQLLEYKFPDAKKWHYYSLLLKSYKKFSASDKTENIAIVFCEAKMILSVYKKGQLQLLQSFFYEGAKDVLYHLLNCCRQLNMSQQEVSLQISGFIEKQSLVYNELAKYFLNISFDETGDSITKTALLDEYPLHYFSTLLKMAACV